MDLSKQRWKRIARMHALRDRIAEWAARNKPDELQEGIRCYLGPHDPDEEMVMQGVGFALVAAAPDGSSLIDRYREAAGKLPRADRTLLDAWQESWFSVCEILTVDPGVGFHLEDVVTGQQVEVIERSASQQLDAGDWIACFLMPVPGGVELEGTSMRLAAATRIAAVQACLRGMVERGLVSAQVVPATSRELAWDVIHAARNQQRKPRILNYDRHRVELITVTLDLEWADVLDATESWDDAVDGGDAVNLLGRHEPALSGPLILATFHDDDGHRVTLTVNSRERLDDVLSVWETQAGSPLGIVEEDVRSVDSDPEGPEILMDSSFQEAESAAQAQADLMEDLATNWLEFPIPALGGLNPRQAVRAGRIPEVRALLPMQLGEDVVRDLRKELGL